MQSEHINELVTALALAQSQIKGAKKDSKNPYFKSDYADLTSTWEAARDPLTKNGLAIVQTMEPREDQTILVTTLAHKSGQWIKSFLPLTIVKKDPQGVGSAITYARRYALSAMLNICPFDDDAESSCGLNDKDVQEIKKYINGNQELQTYFCNRYKTSDLSSINRSQKTEMVQMIKKRNENKQGEMNGQTVG